MDFEPYDSSGTDDDFPPSHQSRISRGRLAGNGRSGVMGSAPYSRVYDDTDMETEIHNIETEAYVSVLKALKAQADVLTWKKKLLSPKLRQELRVSDDEHRDLLKRMSADDAIKRIKEWRREAMFQTGISAHQIVRDPVPSPAASASRKKQKVAQSAHQSFSGPSPMYHSEAPASNPQSSSAAKRGQVNGPKGKKQKFFASSGPVVRGQSVNHVSSGALANEPADPKVDSLIGRKVKTRWPDDNNFYEAVITKFDPTQGLHALVYHKGTAHEIWEWVNLAERHMMGRGDPGISRRDYGGSKNGMKSPVGHDGMSDAGSVKGLPKGQNRREHPHTQNGNANKGSNFRILHPGHLLKEVGRVFNSSNPVPMEIEKAKKALKKQEEALVDTLGKLADISDGESD